jgi:alkylation response protein AidB-like acyl-CoA dehydrogenase
MSDPDRDPSSSARCDLDSWRAAASRNAFDTDPFLRRLLERHLGARFGQLEDRLRQIGIAAGAELDALVAESNLDANLPTLKRQDAFGRPLEQVILHPAGHAVGELFWASGVLSVLAEPGHEVDCGAIAYLLDRHGEAGHACPVACTAGAIKLLQRVGTDDQRQRYLPALLDPDYRSRLHAAQFVTEVQGGSDVGSNSCGAVPDPDRPGWFRISGEKWFCSVADAGLFVVSARLEGAGDGTRGLGLFLVPRHLDGRPNGFALRKLKIKLGTRSMATGEIDFDGALGEPIGPPGDGFRNLVGIVLDTSRVHNAVAACGLMRRVSVEAHHFAAHRSAFGRPILDYPSIWEILSRMRLRTLAATVTTFRILAMTDRLDAGDGDADLLSARRIAVMINKYWTAIAATATARDGIEVLGGNGTIEDFSALPRLYRDAIVIESWEGTHNTLCAQVLRDFASRALHRPWLDVAAREIEAIGNSRLEGPVARARKLHNDVARRIERMLAADAGTASAQIRAVVDRMCRLTDWVALAAQADWDLDRNGSSDCLDALELYRLSVLDGADPQDQPELVELWRRMSREP